MKGRVIPALGCMMLLACGRNDDVSPFAKADGPISDASYSTEGRMIRPNLHFGFEDTTRGASRLISRELAFAGTASLLLDEGDEYSPMIKRRVGDVAEELAAVSAGFWFHSIDGDPRVGIVVTIERGDGEQVAWFGKELKAAEHSPGTWQRFNAEFLLRETKTLPDDSIVFYIWNRGEERVFIDELDLVFGSARIPGRVAGEATDPGDPPTPFASCNCAAVNIESLADAAQWRPGARVPDTLGREALVGGSSHRFVISPNTAVAEIRDEQNARIAWLRPFCPALGIDLLAFERVIVRTTPNGVLLIGVDVDEHEDGLFIANTPLPQAAEFTFATPAAP